MPKKENAAREKKSQKKQTENVPVHWDGPKQHQT